MKFACTLSGLDTTSTLHPNLSASPCQGSLDIRHLRVSFSGEGTCTPVSQESSEETFRSDNIALIRKTSSECNEVENFFGTANRIYHANNIRAKKKQFQHGLPHIPLLGI